MRWEEENYRLQLVRFVRFLNYIIISLNMRNPKLLLIPFTVISDIFRDSVVYRYYTKAVLGL